MSAEIDSYKLRIQDLFTLGDKVVTTAGSESMRNDLVARRDELKAEKDALTGEIRQHQTQVVESSNQDFYDVKQTLPAEPLVSRNKIRTLEDYTLAFLLISYLFMITLLIYLYVYFAPDRLQALGRGLSAAFLLTILCALLLYYFA